MMDSWRLEGSGWVAADALPLDDRGFRYGMSVFETIGIHLGKPLLAGEHLRRLARAAADYGWSPLPSPLPLPPLADRSSGVLRIHATAGPGGLLDPPRGAVYAQYEACETGTDFPPASVALSRALYLPAPGGWKTGNYWQNARALAEARGAGAAEALLFDPAGCLVSACTANIFLEIDGAWQTPARSCGARDGVVRAWVLSRMPAGEALISPEDVGRATAAFLTNSRVGIRPVASLDGRALPDHSKGLREEYRRDVL